MKECRDCKHQVSEQAYMCPGCGALASGKAEVGRVGVRIQISG
jgi:RNA polymerase subunit RPABC4/transcription elongation factor Spt4